jgi:hypothetical protein
MSGAPCLGGLCDRVYFRRAQKMHDDEGARRGQRRLGCELRSSVSNNERRPASTPPTAPTDLTANTTLANSTWLTWSASTSSDSTNAYYDVYEGGNLILTVPASDTLVQFDGPIPEHCVHLHLHRRRNRRHRRLLRPEQRRSRHLTSSPAHSESEAGPPQRLGLRLG